MTDLLTVASMFSLGMTSNRNLQTQLAQRKARLLASVPASHPNPSQWAPRSCVRARSVHSREDDAEWL